MFGTVAAGLLLFAGIAHAAADPTPALSSATDAGWATLAIDGPWWLAIGVLHVILRTFLDKEHGLLQGRLLAGLTALAGVSTAVVAWHWQGAPSVGILTALIAGGTLLVHPVPNTAPATTSSGKLALIAVLLLGAMAAPALTGCTKAQVTGAATGAEHALVNCTAQDLGTTPALDVATLVAVANLVALERAKCTPAGGSLDWHCVETDLIGEGKVLGGCALVAMVSAAATAKPSGVSALASSTPAAPPGRAELEDFRARIAGGATFHTATGDY